MTTNVRISAIVAGAPKGGFVGALTGGTEDGITNEIEVDAENESPLDVATAAAQAYRLAFMGERVSAAGGFGFDGDGDPGNFPIPFPEAGDPHPFDSVSDVRSYIEHGQRLLQGRKLSDDEYRLLIDAIEEAR